MYLQLYRFPAVLPGNLCDTGKRAITDKASLQDAGHDKKKKKKKKREIILLAARESKLRLVGFSFVKQSHFRITNEHYKSVVNGPNRSPASFILIFFFMLTTLEKMDRFKSNPANNLHLVLSLHP